MIADKALIGDDFFDLKARLAGDILQKFSAYSCRLVILGDFSVYNADQKQVLKACFFIFC
ncbi:MAG: DUF4180 domain-containing protein [Prevotellaceae bacterium]|nr:DUF4180 domain-containing protein [Prevotellaceae bacterium]